MMSSIRAKKIKIYLKSKLYLTEKERWYDGRTH